MENIANRQPTEDELELSKRITTVNEAQRRIIEGGGFSIFQMVIDNPLFRKDLIAFARNYVPSALNYDALLKWLQNNKLEKHFQGGSLEKQIKAQEKFYQQLYYKSFRINRKKIFVDARRLPAIKAGLEAGCLNYAMIKAMPKTVNGLMTGAEFFYELIAGMLKKDGLIIWAENGTDRWTKLELRELLRRCNPTETEEFDARALKNDWAAEVTRVIKKKCQAPKVEAGMVEIIFTSNLVDIPSNQVIVNKNGEIVEPDDRSYISAVAKNIRVLSHEEGIILASQLFVENKKAYLAPSTWEWRRDVVDHRDKGTNPPVSVAGAHSGGSGFGLVSSDADDSGSDGRLRLAL